MKAVDTPEDIKLRLRWAANILALYVITVLLFVGVRKSFM